MVYLETVYPDEKTLGSRTVTGERAKLYCTSVGKAILARMKNEEIEELLDDELEAFTENTITDKKKLREEIEQIRVKGYGVDNMELLYGIKCVGVALMNHKGQVEAGLSVSAPSLRMGDEKIQNIANILKRYAREIEKRL